jgi:2-polyprenyl-6-methoxyphenol hydroxylase-like FAD-dependent oxidoreductase
MNSNASNPGVIIIGAGISGCAAAILFAQRGIPVTLIEKRSSSDFHKPICTHYIQPCSLDAWRRIGMYDAISEAGGVKNTIAISTRWGWISNAALGDGHAYNIRRQTLDPLLRAKAASTPGVSLISGMRLTAVERDANGRITGIVCESENEKKTISIPCALLVGADGRESVVAKATGAVTREWENQRFSCFSFFRGIPGESRTMSRMWLLDPYVAYQFPNDGDTTLIALMPTKDRVLDFKRDPDARFREVVRTIPDAPNLERAERIVDYRINIQNSMLLRTRVPRGVALIGDAYITTDPLHGFGISWGLLSACHLVDLVAPVADPWSTHRVDQAVADYHRRWKRRVWSHFEIMAEMARAQPMPKAQQMLFSAAVRDECMAGIVQRFLAGVSGTAELLSPFTMGRAAMVNLRHAFAGIGSRPRPAGGALQENRTPVEEEIL